MKCWCGNEVKKVDTGYACCSKCGTYLSCVDIPDARSFYSFASYWHEHQTNLSYPAIEQRSVDDFNNRIPFWHSMINKFGQERKSILEIGCAHGGFLNLCKNHGFSRCVGVEVDKETCDYVKKRFDIDEVYNGIFPDISIKGNFDYVCAFDVFEHFSNPLSALKKMKELINDNGYIFIQTPRFHNQNDFNHFKPEEHIFIFSDSAISKIFSDAGLSIEYLGESCFPNDMFIVGRKMAKGDLKAKEIIPEIKAEPIVVEDVKMVIEPVAEVVTESVAEVVAEPEKSKFFKHKRKGIL